MTPTTQPPDITDRLGALYWDKVMALDPNEQSPQWTLRLSREDECELERWIALYGDLRTVTYWRDRPFMGMRLEFDAERTEVV